jgi:hypothetical protein
MHGRLKRVDGSSSAKFPEERLKAGDGDGH